MSEDSQQDAPDVTNRAQAPTARPVTDEPSVDEAMRSLDALVGLPVADHVGVFDESHRKLQDALADLDEE